MEKKNLVSLQVLLEFAVSVSVSVSIFSFCLFSWIEVSVRLEERGEIRIR